MHDDTDSRHAQDGPLDPALLDRILAREATPQDTAAFAAWTRAHPDAASSVERLRVGLDAYRHAREFPTGDVAIQRVAHVLTERAGWRASSRTRVAFLNRVAVRWVGAAAVAGLAVVAGMVARRNDGGGSRSASDRVYRTNVGQQASVTLADGSVVTLAPATTLRTPRDFGAGSRTVELDGEVYFAVEHADGMPFLVRAGQTDTRVLGTRFLVRHYSTDSRVRVAVTSGKVAVTARGAHHPGLVLTAGIVGDVTDSSATVANAASSANESAWIDGRLVFTYTPAAEVLATLGRWYGYEFRLADSSMAKRHLTIVLTTRSASSALSTLKLLLDVDLTFDGSVVTLTPRSRHPAQRRRLDRQDILAPHTSEVGR